MKFWLLEEDLHSRNNINTLRELDNSIEYENLDFSKIDNTQSNFLIVPYNAFFHFTSEGSIIIPNTRPYTWISNYQWSSSYLALLKEAQEKGLHIILDYMWEAETTIHSCTLFFLQRCKEFQIDTSKIVFCSNNGLKLGMTDSFIEKYPIKKLNFPWWLLKTHVELCKELFELQIQEKVNDILCKNRTVRINKLESLALLNKYGFLDSTDFTMGIIHSNTSYTVNTGNVLPYILEFLDKYHIDINNFQSIQLQDDIVYGPGIKNDQYLFFTQKHWYEKTKVSVINETFYYDFDPLFRLNTYHDLKVHLTEKTWKGIVFGHPFVLIGERNSLSAIRELGFKTFGDIIDESYDQLPDATRMETAILQLPTLISAYDSEQVQKITQFNRERIFNRDTMIGIMEKYFTLPLKQLDLN